MGGIFRRTVVELSTTGPPGWKLNAVDLSAGLP